MSAELLQFEDFELDRAAHRLRRGGAVVPLEHIPLQLLFFLVDRRGQIVARDEILEHIWGKGVFIDTDNSINSAIRKARHALGDDAGTPRFIVTEPSRGYRFAAQVRVARGAPLAVRPPRSSLVGREAELAELRARLSDACSGHGSLFLISGEPGIGKTRLCEELMALAHDAGMMVLVGRCSEHGEAVPYLPFVELIESAVEGAASPEVLHSLVGGEGPELARLLPEIKRILIDLPAPIDLPPEQALRLLFKSVRNFLARLARTQPVLLVLEDLHWADDSTLSLFDHLAQRVSDIPLLMIATHRDALRDLTPTLTKTLEDLFRGRLATSVRLKGLQSAGVAQMLKSLSGLETPDAVVKEIHAETEGNPFFIEELFHYLDEEGRLYSPEGHLRDHLEIEELEAPQSVRLVAGRRLERLSDRTQQVLGIASLVGRSFSFEVLKVSVESAELVECIEEAERAGLICSRAATPHAQYEFTHELVRQSVASGLSAARRELLHLEVARAIERVNCGALEGHTAELAHHYRLGGDTGKAVDYLVQSARECVARFAHTKAVSATSMGLELLKTMPSNERRDRYELELQRLHARGLSLGTGGGAPQLEPTLERWLELSDCLHDAGAAIAARMGLHTFCVHRADYKRASELREQLLEMAPTITDARLKREIYFVVGLALVGQGDPQAARLELEQALQLSTKDPFISRSGACARALMANVTWALGYPDQALKLMEQAQTEARTLQHPFTELRVADFSAVVCMFMRDAAGAKVHADIMARIANEYGFAADFLSSEIARLWADAWLGDPRCVDLLRETIRQWQAGGAEVTHSSEYGWLAEVCLKYGRIAEAIAAVDDALEFIGRTGQGESETEIYRLKGETEMHLGRSHFGNAAKWFERAIETARKRAARSHELRATISFARLLGKHRKRAVARAMLADIYNWFTEGFDTADLKDAKALLDDLSNSP